MTPQETRFSEKPGLRSEALPQATQVRYQVLAVACVLAVLTYINRLGFNVGAPEIKRDLGLNDQDMGYLASAFLIAYGLFQMPGGFLGDRLGGRHVLTVLCPNRPRNSAVFYCWPHATRGHAGVRLV